MSEDVDNNDADNEAPVCLVHLPPLVQIRSPPRPAPISPLPSLSYAPDQRKQRPSSGDDDDDADTDDNAATVVGQWPSAVPHVTAPKSLPNMRRITAAHMMQIYACLEEHRRVSGDGGPEEAGDVTTTATTTAAAAASPERIPSESEQPSAIDDDDDNDTPPSTPRLPDDDDDAVYERPPATPPIGRRGHPHYWYAHEGNAENGEPGSCVPNAPARQRVRSLLPRRQQSPAEYDVDLGPPEEEPTPWVPLDPGTACYWAGGSA